VHRLGSAGMLPRHMGYGPGDRELVLHVCRVHGWDLLYLNHAKARAQHDAEHRWGVPPPEPNGAWSIYLDSGPSPRTVWD
jgi:hypothetical protein